MAVSPTKKCECDDEDCTELLSRLFGNLEDCAAGGNSERCRDIRRRIINHMLQCHNWKCDIKFFSNALTQSVKQQRQALLLIRELAQKSHAYENKHDSRDWTIGRLLSTGVGLSEFPSRTVSNLLIGLISIGSKDERIQLQTLAIDVLRCVINICDQCGSEIGKNLLSDHLLDELVIVCRLEKSTILLQSIADLLREICRYQSDAFEEAETKQILQCLCILLNRDDVYMLRDASEAYSILCMTDQARQAWFIQQCYETVNKHELQCQHERKVYVDQLLFAHCMRTWPSNPHSVPAMLWKLCLTYFKSKTEAPTSNILDRTIQLMQTTDYRVQAGAVWSLVGLYENDELDYSVRVAICKGVEKMCCLRKNNSCWDVLVYPVAALIGTVAESDISLAVETGLFRKLTQFLEHGNTLGDTSVDSFIMDFLEECNQDQLKQVVTIGIIEKLYFLQKEKNDKQWQFLRVMVQVLMLDNITFVNYVRDCGLVQKLRDTLPDIPEDSGKPQAIFIVDFFREE